MLLFCLNYFRTTPGQVNAAPGINRQINFQGKLVNSNGTNVTNGSYSIVFSIYTVSSAGTAVWTETQTPTVTDGIFQVALGSVTALPGSVDFNTDNIYLGIKVGADAEMTPRIRFGAVPQAFNAERLGGLNSSGFIQNTTSQQTADFNVSGTGRAGTSFTTPTLQNSGANLSIQTVTSGDINITPALATGLVNVLNGNLKVGNGTPTVALNGEDVYIEGTLEVDGASRFDGTVALNGVTTANTDVDMVFAGTENLSVTANGVPTADMVSISNSGQAVTTAGVNALAINYVGGAAAVESSAARIDLQPGGTTGGTWSAWRLVHNATGPATGVTSQALKIEGPTTGGAGVFNGINIANIGATTTGGTVRGINITGTNSQAAGTIRGIQLNNLTGGAASEIGIDLGTGWDNLLTYNNGATVIVNGSGQLNIANVTGTLAVGNGGTGATTSQGAINAISQLTTEGDLLFRNATNSTRLPRGTNGQCLTSSTTTILWGSCGGNSSGWTDGGTTVALTTSTDSVAIGLGTASTKLHVKQGSQGNVGLRIEDSASTAAIDLYTDFGGSQKLEFGANFTIGNTASAVQSGTIQAGRELTVKSFDESGFGAIKFDMGGTTIAQFNTNNEFLISGTTGATSCSSVQTFVCMTSVGVDFRNQGGNLSSRFSQGSNDQLILEAGAVSSGFLGLRIEDVNYGNGGVNLVLKAAAGQTTDLFQLQDSSSAPLAGFTSNGSLYFEGSSNDANEITITASNATANVIYNFANAAAGTYDICTAANNCATGGAATRTVAASNSMTPGRADYQANGNTGAAADGDQVEINQALTAVSAAGGGTVYLMEGTFTVDAAISVPSNVTLKGSGAATIITIPNAFNAAINVITTAAAATNITIQDLTIDGNKSNQTSGTNHGIYIDSTYSTISNVISRNNRNNGIRIVNSNNTITGSRFLNNDVEGMRLECGEYLKITSNHIEGSGTVGIHEGCGAGGHTIANNVIRTSGSHGIYLNNAAYQVTVADNVIDTTGGAGILLWIAMYSTVTGNSIYNAGTHAIHLGNSTENSVINSNSIDRYGIITATSSGIYIDDSEFNTISGNNITDNGGTGYAIEVATGYASNNLITGNKFNGTGASSISDASSNDNIYSGQQTDTTGNALFQNGTNSTAAFQVQNATSSTILFNVDSAATTISIGNGGGTLASWSSDTDLMPVARERTEVVAVNGYIYALGGYNGSDQTAVYRAQIQSDASINAWTTDDALPLARANGFAVAASNGYMYYLGGSTSATVYRSQINASTGDLGAWSTTTALPGNRRGIGAGEHQGYMWVVGGHDGANEQSTVHSAPIFSSGSLGSWTAQTSLPIEIDDPGFQIVNGYMYLVGGLDSNANRITTTYYAKISSGGTLASNSGCGTTWCTSTALPSAMNSQTLVYMRGYLYTTPGYVGTTSNVVYRAPINADGSIGAWVSSTFPVVTNSVGAASYNGYLYGLGGWNGSYQQTLYYTTLAQNTQGSINLLGAARVNSSVDTTTAFSVQNALGSSVLNVDTLNGRVGIGTTTPLAALDVNGGARFSGDVIQVGNGATNALGDQESMLPNSGFEVNVDSDALLADTWGFVVQAGTPTTSINTADPAQGERSQQITATTTQEGFVISACIPLTGGQTYTISARAKGNVAATSTLHAGITTFTSKANCTSFTGPTVNNGALSATNVTTSWASTNTNVTLPAGARWGYVFIGVQTPSVNVTVSLDSIRLTPSALTSGIDLAENFPALAPDNLLPGELVSYGELSAIGESYAVRSNGRYDSKLMGIVSTQPGLTLDDGKDYEKVTVALAGRVPTKVSTENGAIAIGDPITASSIPGVGMKATEPGQIVGYAMAAYDGAEAGMIIVKLAPGFWAPAISNVLQSTAAEFGALQAATATITNLNVTGEATINSLVVLTDATVEGTLIATNLVVKETLTVEGQLVSKGKAPQVAAANTAIMSELAEVMVEGTDTVGTITVRTKENANTALLMGEIAQLTFVKAYAGVPKALISGNNAKSAELNAYIVKTAEGFKLVTDKPLQPNTTYSFEYFVMGFEQVASN